MAKRLYRRRKDRVLWGVCGGLADYFDIDPVIMRVIFVLLIFASGIGILAYIIMAVIVPLEGSEGGAPRQTIKENVQDMKQSAVELGEEIHATFNKDATPAPPESPPSADTDRRNRNILGIVLIILGSVLLMTTLNMFAWFRWGFLWPLILVAVGLLIIFGARRK